MSTTRGWPDAPTGLTFDALSTAGNELANAALKQGSRIERQADIVSATLEPSPELHGAGAGELTVTYTDGIVARFDIAQDGTITPRRAAVAFCFVLEAPEDVVKRELATDGEDHGLYEDLAAAVGAYTDREDNPWTLEYASSPQATRLSTGDYSLTTRDTREDRA